MFTELTDMIPSRPMTAIAVFNPKGGCGKTSLAMNLVGELGGVVLDLDPDGHAALWGRLGNRDDVERVAVGSAKDLRRVIKAQERSPVTILDCPPTLKGASAYAVVLAHLVLIPVAPGVMDVAAAKAAVTACTEAREARGSKLPIVLLVPSRFRRGQAISRDMPSALAAYGPVGPTVHERAVFVYASLEGRTVGEYAPTSAAAEEIRVLARAVRKITKPLKHVL